MNILVCKRYPFVVALFLATILGMVASAAVGVSHADGVATGDQELHALADQKVDIKKKTPEVVITGNHGRFEVLDHTLIVGLDGEQVIYREMLAPCTAVISYYLEEGTQKAGKIQILQISANATPHFFYEKPQ